ncbi:MAG: DUF2905 domain-containing protein [Rickettsiaceae bacterium]|nr:DUF2905 domain-containing protein [Rickettsiaceae bacterium]
MQKLLIILGIVLLILGVMWPFLTEYLKLGRLPGDIIIKKDGVTFYFPLLTCLIISIVVSLVFLFLNK